MKTDSLGIPIYSTDDILQLLYHGNTSDVCKLTVDPNSAEMLQFISELANAGYPVPASYSNPNISVAEFDKVMQNDWLMPDEYKNLDIEQWILHKCPPWDPENTRVKEELVAFKERNMLDLLKWLKYFVDTCREKNILWGVGRGSSVASYVLYLIGVHKIDSIKYNLDWREFLR